MFLSVSKQMKICPFQGCGPGNALKIGYRTTQWQYPNIAILLTLQPKFVSLVSLYMAVIGRAQYPPLKTARSPKRTTVRSKRAYLCVLWQFWA